MHVIGHVSGRLLNSYHQTASCLSYGFKGVYAQIQTYPYMRTLICQTQSSASLPPSLSRLLSLARPQKCTCARPMTMAQHRDRERMRKRHHERRRPFCIGRATLQVKQTSKQAIHHFQTFSAALYVALGPHTKDRLAPAPATLLCLGGETRPIPGPKRLDPFFGISAF